MEENKGDENRGDRTSPHSRFRLQLNPECPPLQAYKRRMRERHEIRKLNIVEPAWEDVSDPSPRIAPFSFVPL
jgi:hypothetical protein